MDDFHNTHDLSISDDTTSQSHSLSRRGFVLVAGAAILAGMQSCTKPTKTSQLPDVPWPGTDQRAANFDYSSTRTRSNVSTSSNTGSGSQFPDVITRSTWSRGNPNFKNMNRMLPVKHITIHHDGMQPMVGSSESVAKSRLESIRHFHRNGRGWGDIGYHFAIDRAGRIWEARPIGWQGAHVKDHNEGNIGILAMGNFDQQSPSDAQVAALAKHVAAVASRYRISPTNIRTHQEWAATACPGRYMQSRIVSLRSNRRLG